MCDTSYLELRLCVYEGNFVERFDIRNSITLKILDIHFERNFFGEN